MSRRAKVASREGSAVQLTCVIQRQGEVHVARCVEVPASACGATARLAVRRLERALRTYFADGGEVPASRATLVEFVQVPVKRRKA